MKYTIEFENYGTNVCFIYENSEPRAELWLDDKTHEVHQWDLLKSEEIVLKDVSLDFCIKHLINVYRVGYARMKIEIDIYLDGKLVKD